MITLTRGLYIFLSAGSWFFAGFDFLLLPALSFVYGRIFFPDPNPMFTILAIFGTLSLSLLGRVFGGIFFGKISDRYGRRPVILITTICLSITMILFSQYLPLAYTHMVKHDNPFLNQVYIPSIVFVISRILIGFLIGGVWPTAGTLAVENLFQNYKYKFYYIKDSMGNYIRDSRGHCVEGRAQRCTAWVNYIILEKSSKSDLLKTFSNLDQLLEGLFVKLCSTIEIKLEDKREFNQYMSMLYEKTLILKSEKDQTEKLKKIIALIENLQKDMAENFDLAAKSEDGLPKHEYDLSNLILNIKEIEKLVYIEKLWVLERAVESESKDTNGSRYLICKVLNEVKDLKKYDRMEKLTWQSGVTQFGFSFGLLMVAIVGVTIQNSMLDSNLLTFVSNIHLYFGIFGLLWFIVLFLFLKESVILEYETKKNKKLKNFIGLRELLQNDKTRTTLFNFWLIMTGLLYLYYSTIIVAADILSRNEIENWLPLDLSSILSLNVQFAIVSVIAHLSIPLICYFAWRKGNIHNLLFNYKISAVYNELVDVLKIMFGGPNKHNQFVLSYTDLKNSVEKLKKIRLSKKSSNSFQSFESVDIKFMILLGVTLVILGILVFFVFYFGLTTGNPNFKSLVIPLTMAVIFVGNGGFGLIPSMIASRFPVHLRNIGSSVAYNGGLAIGFASPFISMEFFLFVKSDYLLSIPILLGATSIIIGSLRLLKDNQ